MSTDTDPVAEEAVVLKPCPFCGSDARTIPYRAGYHPLWIAACNRDVECGAQMDSFHTEADAIVMWNTRPLPTSLQPQEQPEQDQGALVGWRYPDTDPRDGIEAIVANAIVAGIEAFKLNDEAAMDAALTDAVRAVFASALLPQTPTHDEELARLREALEQIEGFSEENGMTRRKMRRIASAALRGSNDRGG